MFKLIRDNIPEIMAENNKICDCAVAQNKELYFWLLKNKLVEETNEFLESETIEELADLYTVMLALIDELGYSSDEFMKVYTDKLVARGGFTKKLIGFFPDKQTENKCQ